MTQKTTNEKGGKLMKKTLSLILAVLMIMATMPMAFAAETLKAANIVDLPTLSYKNADNVVYFGQTLEDAIIINDDEFVKDATGNQVAGHFEFMKPSLVSPVGENIKTNLKFIPDDTSAYTTFNKLFCADRTYTVVATTPLYVDETNDPVVATKDIDKEGKTLSDYTLSGGKMYNPYNATETNLAERKWTWTDPTTTVLESGYYEARFTPIGYTLTTAQVWVQVDKKITETEVSEAPAAIELTYGDVAKYSELTFSGVAVEKGTDKVVEGTFAPNDLWKNTKVKVGTHDVVVAFTPDDTENYYGTECTVTVTVTPAIPTWKDGEAVITVPYGTKIDSSFDWYLNNELDTALKDLLKSWGYKTIDGAEITGDFVPTVGTHEVTANLNLNGTGSQNWQTDTMMTFTLVVEGKTLDCILKPIGSGGYQVINDSLAYNAAKPQGTFTVIGKLSDTVVSENTVKYGEIFKPAENVSGTYTYEIKYNPIENDPFIIADFTSEQNAVCSWKATIDEVEKTFVFGETISLSSDKADFYRWNITDTNGNPIDVVIVSGSLESASVAFTMPDCDIIITSEIKEAGDIGGDIDFGDIDGIDGILDFLRGIIEKIKSVFEKIIEFFQSIGDMS